MRVRVLLIWLNSLITRLRFCLIDKYFIWQQEAFRERRHLHVCDLWPWRVTLTLLQGQESYVIRCRLLYCALIPGMMNLNVTVCEIWPLIHFVTFDLHLWPSAYVKVSFTLISRCTLCICSCTLVPSIKFVGSTELEI